MIRRSQFSIISDRTPVGCRRWLTLVVVGSAFLFGCSKISPDSAPTVVRYVSEIQDGRSVSSIAFSPDGRILACGGGELTKSGEIKLWDTQSGTLLRTLGGHSDSVTSVAFSGDGKLLASGSGIHVIPSAPIVQTLTGQPSELKLWDAATGELRHSLTTQGGVSAVAFSVDGKVLASGGGDKSVNLWDAQSGELQRRLSGHEGVITSVAFSPDGQTLASGSTDRTVRIWNAHTGELQKTLKDHDFLVTSIAFSPDSKTIASGDASAGVSFGSLIGVVRLWNVQTGELKRKTTGLADLVTSVTFSRDGKTVVGSTRPGWIYFHDAETEEPKRLETNEGSTHSYDVNAIAFSPDGRVLATARSDKIVRFIKTE